MRISDWSSDVCSSDLGPLTALLPPVTTVWLDGAHNADAGLHLARHFESEPRRIHLITGMLANKQPDAILAPLAGRIASITAVPVPGHDHHPPPAFGPAARHAAPVEAALGAFTVDPARELAPIPGPPSLAAAGPP